VSDHSMEPVAWCDDRALAGSIGNTASAAAKRYWEEGHPVDRNSAKKLCHPLYSAQQLASLEHQLAAEKERADYAWRNTNTIEKARQEEMAKRDDLTKSEAALKATIISLLEILRQWEPDWSSGEDRRTIVLAMYQVGILTDPTAIQKAG
jgi:hypothetical protein